MQVSSQWRCRLQVGISRNHFCVRVILWLSSVSNDVLSFTEAAVRQWRITRCKAMLSCGHILGWGLGIAAFVMLQEVKLCVTICGGIGLFLLLPYTAGNAGEAPTKAEAFWAQIKAGWKGKPKRDDQAVRLLENIV